jgi:ribosome production factor 1
VREAEHVCSSTAGDSWNACVAPKCIHSSNSSLSITVPAHLPPLLPPFHPPNPRHPPPLQNHGRATTHKPELILNNFDTRLGHRIGRFFASLFSQDPTFKGRRAVTFHNQRDFIFFRWAGCVGGGGGGGGPGWAVGGGGEDPGVPPPPPPAPRRRHHRYVFEEAQKRERGKKEKTSVVKARLQELGPRFTLKLESLQKGTFDSKGGEFEWVNKGAAEKGYSRTRYNL